VAKKTRTPPPPRKVQAPKTRTAPRTLDERRRWYIAIGIGAAGLIGLAVALGVVLASGGGSSSSGGNLTDLATTMRAAGCTFTTVTSSGDRHHLQSLNDKISYNTYPPTSGPHYQYPAIWNNYSQIVNPRQAVHNQEHGGVVVWYGPNISQANRQKINEFYDQSPNAILVTPIAFSTPGITYPPHKPLGSKIALTAWDAPSGAGKAVIAICPNVNLPAFETFRDIVRGKGPEHFPVSALQPGT
jgi:Protein of unknown function (DUF3105)